MMKMYLSVINSNKIIAGFYDNSDFKWFNKVYAGSPIESLTLIENCSMSKCFTLFSHEQNQWRNYTTYIYRIFIRIENHAKIIFKPEERGKVYISIHSPNDWPSLTPGVQFIKILNNFKAKFEYSVINARLLGSGFDINCFDYDLDHKFANYKIRLYVKLFEREICMLKRSSASVQVSCEKGTL